MFPIACVLVPIVAAEFADVLYRNTYCLYIVSFPDLGPLGDASVHSDQARNRLLEELGLGVEK